jgi:hypothetical protein
MMFYGSNCSKTASTRAICIVEHKGWLVQQENRDIVVDPLAVYMIHIYHLIQ